jgi:hypothetical protein
MKTLLLASALALVVTLPSATAGFQQWSPWSNPDLPLS